MQRQIYDGLIARGLSPHVAIGIMGNMAVESRFDPGINEIAPLVEGSRGGYGLNQWTGPRRRQYETYASERGVSPDDLDTQLDFTLWELANTERAAGQALSRTATPEEAARVYSEKFLRPGIPHLERRISEASKLSGVAQEPRTEPQRGENALAAVTQPREQENRLALAMQDPADFMVSQNRMVPTENPFLRFVRQV